MPIGFARPILLAHGEIDFHEANACGFQRAAGIHPYAYWHVGKELMFKISMAGHEVQCRRNRNQGQDTGMEYSRFHGRSLPWSSSGHVD